mgnify:CR=1 FL=1
MRGLERMFFHGFLRFCLHNRPKAVILILSGIIIRCCYAPVFAAESESRTEVLTWIASLRLNLAW